MTTRSVSTRSVSIVIFLLAAIFANQFGFLEPVQNWINAQRMSFAPRALQGDFAFVAIDKKSLDDVGVWPWPRSIHARLVDKLVAANAKDIAFDVDFSARSNPVDDQAFADALKRAEGTVILASFLQAADAASQNTVSSASTPIEDFAANAWLATVNVVPDADGQVRAFPYGGTINNTIVASLPATLARQPDLRTDRFQIDFSIDPKTIPTYSASDVLKPDFDLAKLAGKSVVIGAYAVELKDFFNTPVHGIIAGPVIQILAADTLEQGRALTPVQPAIVLGPVFVLLLLSMTALRPKKLGSQAALLIGIAALTEGAGFALQTRYPLVLPTAPVHLLLILLLLNRAVEELGLRKWLVRIAHIESRNNRHLLEQIIDDSTDAILILDEACTILDMSRSAEHMFGLSQEHNGPGIGALPKALRDSVLASVQALKEGANQPNGREELRLDLAGDIRVIEYSVTPSRLETASDRMPGKTQGTYVATVSARDITREREQQEKLDYVSRHDLLTGALRQNEFEQQLDAILADNPAIGYCHAVFAINLHRFKTINATLGRDIGDTLLQAAVGRLQSMTPAVRLVARIGGDTFAILFDETLRTTSLENHAQLIIRSLEMPFQLGSAGAKVGAHIGVAFADARHPQTGISLLSNAEFALDQARKINGSGTALFDPSSSAKILKSRQIEHELWSALDKEEITVAYQPQVDLDSLNLIGVEALIRWNHPQLGFISPSDFVEIAEANGFVENLGRWILERACFDATRWTKPITVAVNVSGLQFTRGDLVHDVEEALKKSRLEPHRLHLEITESAFLNPSGGLIDKLHELRSMGVSLALDDFGTGYSSFGYLAKFPLDKIKVDQMFVRNLINENSARAIVRSVRTLTQGLNIKMICEGVETPAELDFLRKLGCEQGQGYLFGKPKPWHEIEAYERIVA